MDIRQHPIVFAVSDDAAAIGALTRRGDLGRGTAVGAVGDAVAFLARVGLETSLAVEGPAIAFSFRPQGGLEWLGRYEINTSKLRDSITVRAGKKQKACAMMAQLLENCDVPAKKVYAALAEIGIGSRTVEKAKKEMKIRTYRSGDCWYWGLPRPEERD